MGDRPLLGEILVQAGLIDEARLAKALGEQRRWGGRLGLTLLRLGLVEEEDLMRTLARQLGVPAVRLAGKKIGPEVLELLPQELAEKYRCLPLFTKREAGREVLFLGMDDPTDLAAIDDVSFRTGRRIRPILIGPESLQRALKRFYDADDPYPLALDDEDLVEPGASAPPAPDPALDPSDVPTTARADASFEETSAAAHEITFELSAAEPEGDADEDPDLDLGDDLVLDGAEEEAEASTPHALADVEFDEDVEIAEPDASHGDLFGAPEALVSRESAEDTPSSAPEESAPESLDLLAEAPMDAEDLGLGDEDLSDLGAAAHEAGPEPAGDEVAGLEEAPDPADASAPELEAPALEAGYDLAPAPEPGAEPADGVEPVEESATVIAAPEPSTPDGRAWLASLLYGEARGRVPDPASDDPAAAVADALDPPGEPAPPEPTPHTVEAALAGSSWEDSCADFSPCAVLSGHPLETEPAPAPADPQPAAPAPPARAQQAAPAVPLSSETATDAPASKPNRGPTTRDVLRALTELLIDKGVIEAPELLARVRRGSGSS